MSTPATPPTAPATDPVSGHDPDAVAATRWRTAGLVVLGVWALLLAVAVVLWARVAVFADPDDGANGAIRLFGAPFVLLALGILWWVWRSARHLRQGRPEGWLLPIALGAVALLQSALTVMPLLASAGGAGSDAVAPVLVGTGLGVASLTVGVLGRRSWARTAEEDADGDEDDVEGTDDLHDPATADGGPPNGVDGDRAT